MTPLDLSFCLAGLVIGWQVIGPYVVRAAHRHVRRESS